MTPEIIAILAVGATVIGLLLTQRRDARFDNRALRAEFRADNQRLRDEMDSFRVEVRADNQNLRAEVRAEMQDLREEVHRDVAGLRIDVQALTERMSRVEGVIQGFFARRDRTNDTA